MLLPDKLMVYIKFTFSLIHTVSMEKSLIPGLVPVSCQWSFGVMAAFHYAISLVEELAGALAPVLCLLLSARSEAS